MILKLSPYVLINVLISLYGPQIVESNTCNIWLKKEGE